jgi:hypothetical protein
MGKKILTIWAEGLDVKMIVVMKNWILIENFYDAELRIAMVIFSCRGQ